ncbi:MAG: hypothetical protein K5675_10065, partial [Lachnospiraceae bacterium]|nr:hypothetical protein [Lachnospiraceae bacterium]
TDDMERVDRYFYAYRNDYVTAKKRGVLDLAIYYAGFYLNCFRVLFQSKDGKKQRLGVMKKGLIAGRKFRIEK